MIYSINEGKQAEEYKARKAKEKKDVEDASATRVSHRYPVINSHTGDKNRDMNPSRDDDKRNIAARNMVHMNGIGICGGKKYSYEDRNSAYDATNRHMRRHPNQYKESSDIFGSIKFI